jgi:hypothetical protein
MLVALTGLAATQVNAECANACSGHGTCGARDACSCYKNWMGNDCSLRICPFAHAFVDSPKGDLDMSGGELSAPASTVVIGDEVYPVGTTEQYPNADADEGHFYMECANKGLCNRKTGDCECFDGYEGTACARTVCPNTCSGHGTCETIQELAEMGTFDTTAGHVASTTDFTYSYDLWDQEKSVGCKCDEGYHGNDCAQKKCKYGVDPLFESEGVRIAPEFRVKTAATGGTFKLKMFDVFGEDYITKDIPFDATADVFCEAIDMLPNGVFDMDRTSDHTKGTHYANSELDNTYYECLDPDGSGDVVEAGHKHNEACCGRNADGDFFLYLHNNPGFLKAPAFFSSDPTAEKLTPAASDAGVGHVSFSPGEYMDYFGIKMDLGSQLLPGTTAPIASYSGTDITCADTGACDTAETALAITYPALIKIGHEVSVVTAYATGVWTTAETAGEQAGRLDDANIQLAPYVYFASATLTNVVDASTQTVTQEPVLSAPNTWEFTGGAAFALEKEDQFVYLDVLYTIASISQSDTFVATITTVESFITGGTSSGLVYKVVWDTTADTNFEYTTQCSNRGVCESSTGLCKCFKGYSNDNCDTQNAYAL